MTNPKDPVVVGAARTPIGRFGGTLKDVRAYELGGVAVREAIDRASLEKGKVTEVILGSCRQAGNGPNPARSAALLAGLDNRIPASTLNMACPSGMKAMMLAADSILAGSGEFIVAGGMDSMSTIPHMVRGLRFQARKMGDILIEDGWKDATDPVAETTMGQTAELLAKRNGVSRGEQDEFALESHKKAIAAQKSGAFDQEIVPVTLEPAFSHGKVELHGDETPRGNTSIEKLGNLPPAFSRDGSVTAGNSSAMSDGACALVLTSRGLAEGLSKPIFSIVGTAQAAVDGALMGEGPQISIPLVLQKAGLTLEDMDLLEVNEAFATQILTNEKALGWDPERLNVHGGAIALGHPTGISGARIVITLAHALRTRDKELGLAAICGAGGVTTAMIIKRES